MAKANITQYSSTPSSNTDINNIDIDENCPASGLNNAIRELMAHLKNVDTGSQALTALSVTGDLTVDTDTLKVDSTNNRVGIGTTSPLSNLDIAVEASDTRRFLVNYDDNILTVKGSNQNSNPEALRIVADNFRVSTGTTGSGTEAMRIDSSGNLLVGTTNSSVESSSTDEGVNIFANKIGVARDGGITANFNRLTSDGDIIKFRKDGSTVGTIGCNSGLHLVIGKDDTGLNFQANEVIAPSNPSTGSVRDNAIDLGASNARFDDIFATNGTIQTSDQNEKNTITNSDLGIDFIKRLEPKSYIFNGKTRTHYGLIAQDVETVLSDINKPTSGFAGFIKSDISEEQDGSEYRYGLRYTEFVAPLIQAVKDQQAIIEDLQARITALENA